MKNLRKAALAVATASSVAFAGTSVAVAQEGTDSSLPTIGDNTESSLPAAGEGSEGSLSNGSWDWGTHLDADTPVTGAEILGSEGGEGIAAWGAIWKYGTYALVAGAIAGLIIGGINQLKSMGLIKDGQ